MVTRLPEEQEAQPVLPLEYAQPQPRTSRRDLWLGLLVSFFLANGVGWMIFGILMREGWRDDHAGPVAVGLAFIVLALSLAATILWLRRALPR
jgi:hypothetical protein